MLMLLVCTCNYTYAINSEHIKEIIPYVKIKTIPQVPTYLVGQISFNGIAVPVVDLSFIVEGKPSSPNMGTRIVLLQPKGEKARLFGLVAENVTETIEVEKAECSSLGVQTKSLPFFSYLCNTGGLSFQLIDVDHLYEFLKAGAGL